MKTFEKNLVFSCHIYTNIRDELDAISMNNVKVNLKNILCRMQWELGKGKGKFHPITGHESPEME
jgi:hypothetical protein